LSFALPGSEYGNVFVRGGAKLSTRPFAIVFDLGKVLLDFDYGIAADKLAARGKVSPGEINRFINQSPLLFRYETGLMTQGQFFEELCAFSGFSGSLEEFGGFFSNIFSPIEEMVRLHEHLRQQGFSTYIFSNTNDLAIKHIRRNFPFFANFDGYILSYEHGAMKPDAKLYEVVEQQSGHRGGEIIYIDDRAENIAAGAARGWQVILQVTPAETLRALEKLSIRIPPDLKVN
jgi:FMN phosphatase YigB (HAD superfamily)